MRFRRIANRWTRYWVKLISACKRKVRAKILLIIQIMQLTMQGDFNYKIMKNSQSL